MTETSERIKERKLFQWAIAYVAGGWLLLELLGFVADNFGWPASIIRGATVLLGVGFFVTLVLAWYHGEKGHQHVNGVELLMLAALLLIGGVAVRVVTESGDTDVAADASRQTVLAPPLGASAADAASIAILPFENQSADPDNEYFSDGITDDIITQLAQIEELTVISKTSVMRYRDRGDKSLREIGEELRVAAILQGGVRRAGDRVRITAQLVDARTDRHLWAQTYDQELTAANIFAIQSDVALAIASALRATLAPDVSQRIETAPTTSLEAYDLYARGRYLWGQQTRESLEASVDFFQRAIAIDSAYALAYSGLSDSYNAMWNLFFMPEAEALPLAKAAAETAVRLDPELARAHASIGTILQFEMRWDEARTELERALELDPGDALSRQAYSFLLLMLGLTDEALVEMRRSVELDPVSIQSRTALATLLLFAREYQEAIDETSNILEFEPHIDYLYYVRGFAHAKLGDLDRAAAEEPASLSYIQTDPTVDPIRDDPRYDALLKRLGMD
jgi:TolB-like protein